MVNKVEVIVEYEIPDGYELAEPRVRTPKKGEIYLSEVYKVPHIADRDFSHVARPILKKSWKPEVGKYYLFSHSRKRVDQDYGILAKLHKIDHEGIFIATNPEGSSSRWKYCWPVPCEVDLGK